MIQLKSKANRRDARWVSARLRTIEAYGITGEPDAETDGFAARLALAVSPH